MRLYDHVGVSPWLLFAISGLALTCSQACANGKTHETGTEVTASGGTLASSAQGSGGTSQGGTGNNGGTNDVATGGNGQGGDNNTGGVSDGGNPGTGGQGEVTGGTGSDGGAPPTGGQGATDSSGGDNNVTGGTNATGGMPATGATPGLSCMTALNCVSAPNNQTTCDSSTGTCVQCVNATDCVASFGANNDCISKKCVGFDPCTTSTDCSNGRACDTVKGRCVECAGDTDCANGQKCVSQTCRTGCVADNACTPSGMLCNTTLGICVKCGCTLCAAAQLTCTGGLVCDPTGVCGPPVCNAHDKICSNNGVASCKSDGSGFGTPLPCPANSSCKASAGAVACYGDGGDGGMVDNCAVGGNPCQQIPMLTGTQTVDGLGDDLCSVPAVKFSSATPNVKVLPYHTTPPEVATVRVAWSAAALNVFIDVLDASVKTASQVDATQQISKIYQGDSIELMISSSNTLTGLTSADNNTLHVTVPAAGPAVSVKTSNSGGASQGAYTPLPTDQYAQKLTATGYAIEMRLPWPGGAPTAGATVRFDMALNSADSTYTNVDDLRDGQLIYYIGTVATTTCQGTGGDGNVPFCDDRLWCSTTVSP